MNDILQAIVTRYISPTNTRGARIKARASAGSKIYDWDHALNVEDNHHAAAMKYMVEKNWAENNCIVGGSTKSGYCWVQLRLVRISLTGET